MASLVDDLEPSSQQVGAINVARREANGRWHGAIYDGWGCVLGMIWEGHDPAGKRILLVGCGGAGSAIGFALAQMNPAQVAIADSTRELRSVAPRKSLSHFQIVRSPLARRIPPASI
jgi:shikimate dehydrogenase